MKFARLGPAGQEVPVVVGEDGVRSLAGLTEDIDAHFWESDGPALVAAALAAGELPSSRTPPTCASAPRSAGRARSSASA